MKQRVDQYLAYLEAGNYDELMNLFAESAVVDSPLLGQENAKEFYKKLFSKTSKSKISLIETFVNEESRKVAAHFQCDWVLSDGTPAPFEVVDIFEFDDQKKIVSLKIIYDTEQTRKQFNTATKNKN